ncbi:MAG: S9 family peptidase, partial [Bacteroidota bacterium]
MKYPLLLILAFLIGLGACNETGTKAMTDQTTNYPIAEKKDSILTTHGDRRVDPYFWMRLTDEQKLSEAPDAQTQQVVDYLNAENEYTAGKLKNTANLQEELYDEMVARVKQDDESVPYFKNDYWYYVRYETGKEYPIYCRKKASLDNPEQVILDVNEMAADRAYYHATGLAVSQDNKLLAFNEDTLSRRIYTVRFKNLETGELLEDQLPNSDGSLAWANDNRTIFYTTKNEVSLLSEKIVRHQLGTSSTTDEVVYEEKDPSFYIGVYKSKSTEYIIIWNSSTLVSDYHILNANDPQGQFQQFSARDQAHEYSIDHFQDKFYVLTNWEAQNFRLMETPVSATSKPNWKEVVPHRPDVLIDNIEVFEDFLVLAERSNALTNLRVIDQRSGDTHYIEFDEPAYDLNLSTNPEFKTPKLRFSYSSLTTPRTIYDYQMKERSRELKKRDEVKGHDPSLYKTERLFAVGRDGTKIPISLVYREDMVKEGPSPMLLYAYGSYGSSTDPSFSMMNLSLIDRGFTYAIAHIRGGQEMGRQWYEDGKMFKKKNTFYDFIDCAKFLTDEGYTQQDRLYALGGSAGGLLMGAVANLAPDAFHGIVAAVPFVDVVSTMLDESIP